MPIREEFFIQDSNIRDALRTVIQELNRPIDWHYVGQSGEPEFLNYWRNVGGDYDDCAFGMDIFQGVHLKGSAVGGISNTVIFILPLGYRPNKRLRFAIPVEDIYGQMEININGTVKVLQISI